MTRPEFADYENIVFYCHALEAYCNDLQTITIDDCDWFNGLKADHDRLTAEVSKLKSKLSDIEEDLDTCTKHNAELMAELVPLRSTLALTQADISKIYCDDVRASDWHSNYFAGFEMAIKLVKGEA